MKKKQRGTFRRKLSNAARVATALAVLVPAVSLAESAGNPAAAATQGNATKSETVYVNADATGAVRQEIVSAWLHDDTAGAIITDQSDLSGIVNVKGSEKPEQTGNSVVWKLNGNDIYYQGKTTKQLPVTMNIHYYLDGKEVAPSQLTGRSGRFELKLSFQNHDAHSVFVSGKLKTIYTPFACVAAFNLPAKTFTNVTTNFGNIIGDGNNQAISFMGFPGLKESFDMLDLSSANLPEELHVTADVKNFSLGPIMMAATPVPDMDSLKNTGNITDLTSKLSQLIDAGAQLKDGAGKLNSGEKAFADGVGQLYAGVSTAGASFGQITAGAQTLNSSASNTQTGLPALMSGANSLNSGAGQLSGGLGQLFAQFGTGTAQAPTLKDQIGTLNNGAQQLAGGVGQLLAQFSPAAAGQTPTLYDSINALSAGTSQYKTLANSVLFGMVAANLQTLQNALASALTPTLTAQGMPADQIAATIAQATQSAVQQELYAFHGTADAAMIQYCTAQNATDKQTYLNAANLYINLYDALSIVATDPGVAKATDAAAKEAAYEQAMLSASPTVAAQLGIAPSASLYSFSLAALPTTLKAAAIPDAQQTGLESAASAVGEAKLQAVAKQVNAQNIVLAGASLTGGVSALAAQFKTAAQGEAATLYDSIGALNMGAQQVEGGTAALAAQTVAGTDAQHPTLYDSIGALNSGASSLSAGANTLASGASGLTVLQNGISTLAGGILQFSNGLVTMKSGASTLNSKAAELTSGAAQLNDGVSRLWSEGISKLQQVDTGKINDAVSVKDEMIKLADSYTSFSGTPEGVDTSVKFVVKTDEIKAVSGTAAQQTSASATKSLSFWQKIGNWFRDLFHK